MSYYVYTYSDPDTNQPFYVGKGTEYRSVIHLQEAQRAINKPGRKSRKINKIIKILKQNKLPLIDKVVTDITNDEACKIEIELILKFGRLDIGTGILYNLTDGGDGCCNRIMCEQEKQRIAVRMTGNQNYNNLSDEIKVRNNEAARARMKTNNPMNDPEKRAKVAASKKGQLNPNDGKPGTFSMKTHSDESKKRISDARKCLPKTQCEHCGRRLDPSNFKAHHGDKCKLKDTLASFLGNHSSKEIL